MPSIIRILYIYIHLYIHVYYVYIFIGVRVCGSRFISRPRDDALLLFSTGSFCASAVVPGGGCATVARREMLRRDLGKVPGLITVMRQLEEPASSPSSSSSLGFSWPHLLDSLARNPATCTVQERSRRACANAIVRSALAEPSIALRPLEKPPCDLIR